MVQNMTFRCYKVSAELDKGLFDAGKNEFEIIYDELVKTKKPDNLYTLNGYPAFVKHISNNIFCFEKHRDTDIPVIGKKTEDYEREIKLNEGETILEKNYFLFNKDVGYIIYQEKKEGFRGQTLGPYIQKLCKGNVFVAPILQRDTIEKLFKIGYIKGADITLASPSDAVLKEWGIDVNPRIAFGVSGATTVKVGFTLDKKQNIVKEVFDMLMQKLEKTSDSVTKLKIRGSHTDASRTESIDLLNDLLESKMPVRTTDRIKMQKDIIKNLVELDERYRDEISEMIL